jgi:general L-amino acid transport system permease protein
MNLISDNLKILIPRPGQMHFDARRLLQEQITSSWVKLIWLTLLTGFTLFYTFSRWQNATISTLIILLIWLFTLSLSLMGELKRQHTNQTLWLKNNLYNSITNIQISLVLSLLIFTFLSGLFAYSWTNASFNTTPIRNETITATVTEVANTYGVNLSNISPNVSVTRPTLYNQAGTVLRESTFTKQEEDPNLVTIEHRKVYTGATWGAVIVNLENLFVFRFKEQIWRVYLSLGLLIALIVPSIFIYQQKYKKSRLRSLLTLAWVISPFFFTLFLRGFTWSSLFPYVNPDIIWGGFLLTVIISIFAIVVSFPLGLLLALGRRSKIYGIPWWLIYPLSFALTFYLLATRTPTLWAESRNNFEQLLAFWPLLIMLIAYLFHRYFGGNAVALYSTLYIEVVRGVPLITVLFMAIVLFPLFLPANMEVLNTTRVMFAFALFSAAYLAENVRGGLQALNKGQYEAAEALGLGTFDKYRLIILPQALRAVIPAIVGQFIGLFKDTSLVFLVGLFDILAVANSIASQPDWLGIRTEPYLFVIVLYFICSALMASYSRRLERQLGVGER